LPERIYKLQPDRTVSLRGFDSFAAAASIHSATPTGFTVSGTFRDPADFAVAVLYDADNFFEHPSIRYLPDFNFSGLTLNFNLRYTDGLQPIDSPKYNWIDWATLDCIRADGSTAQVRLWDHAMLADPSFPAASASFNVVTSSVIQPYDRVTLWYQNLAFDYIAAAGQSAVEFQFYAGGAGTTHSISISGRTYSHTESAGESSANQAAALIAAINSPGDADVIAYIGSVAYAVTLSVRDSRAGISIPVSASDGNASGAIYLTTPELVATDLTRQINSVNWISANTTYGLMASSTGARITITAARYGSVNVTGAAVTWVSGARFAGISPGDAFWIAGTRYTVASIQSPVQLTLTSAAATASNVQYVAARGGRDGNLIRLYSVAKTPTLSLDRTNIQMAGGRSDVTWNCTLDFSALGIDQLRQSWLTFAPALGDGAAYAATEWEAAFSNWQVTGPESVRTLQVAGPGSIRIEEDNPACAWQGNWNVEAGFYSKYFAKATSDPAGSVTVSYTCQFTHNLYIGTSLYSDRAVAGVRLDGDTETSLDCRLNTGSAAVTRRMIRSSVAPGRHSVTFRLQQPGVFYFDFLEAAVLSDVPDPLPARANISPALDFDTDHTYKLPPARLMWIFDRLGYAGPMNEYLGVFWWNERKLARGSVSQAKLAFTGTFAGGDSVFLALNGTTLGKTVFPTDTPATIANHFAAYINGAFVGAWASAEGVNLTITSRSPAPAYALALSITVNSAAGHGAITAQPQAGAYGSWVVDDAATQPINRAARDWHADFYSQCAGRGRQVTTACSMELVNPPDGFAARFPDPARTAVSTATGFGSLASNHCAVGSSKMLAWQKQIYRAIAQLQTAAGLTPSLQYGEFLWWYFAGPGGMAFYDDETMAAAETALGRSLHVFSTPDDDPSVNGGADALFLRNRLRDHLSVLVSDIRAAYPGVKCEILWPYDVNYPSPVPAGQPYLGGRLNRFINLPVEWQQKPSSGVDSIKVEALAFGTGMRDLNLAREAIGLFPAFGWPLDSVRYLVPVFGSATPWTRELNMVWGAGIPIANLWAFDHICLYNLDVPEKKLERRSFTKAA
jgi:hypothetical protein